MKRISVSLVALFIAVSVAYALPTTQPSTQPAQEQKVYGTKTGTKYHRAGCSSLKKSSIEMTLSGAKDRGLTPCSRCKP